MFPFVLGILRTLYIQLCALLFKLKMTDSVETCFQKRFIVLKIVTSASQTIQTTRDNEHWVSLGLA